MPQENQIDVEVYPIDEIRSVFFKNVNYISFVSSPGGQGEGTYGIPAKIADRDVKGDGLPAKILYVNPANIMAMLATRKA